MKIFFTILSALILSCSHSDRDNKKITILNQEELINQVLQDIERIQPATPEKFRQLNMNWKAAANRYKDKFLASESLDQKIKYLQKLYYSYHDGHFQRTFKFKGLASPKFKPLYLPIKLRPFGDNLSSAKFVVTDIDNAYKWPKNIKPELGDVLRKYNSKSVPELIKNNKEIYRDSGVPLYLTKLASFLTRQSRWSSWVHLPQRKLNQIVNITLVRDGKPLSLEMRWQKRFHRKKTDKALTIKGYEIKSLAGSLSDDNFVLLLTNSASGRKYLLIRLKGFMDSTLKYVEAAQSFVTKPINRNELSGVILDFSRNGGGNDMAFPFLYQIVGRDFALNWHSLPKLSEFEDDKMFDEAANYSGSYEYYKSLYAETKTGRAFPVVPFNCSIKGCQEGDGYFSETKMYAKLKKKKKHKLKPLPIAFISGLVCASKCDELAKVVSVQNLGVTLGTPNIGMDGRFNTMYNEYKMKLSNGKEIPFKLRFVPTISMDNRCQFTMGVGIKPKFHIDDYEIQNNRPSTYIKAINALSSWSYKKPKLCSREQANAKLRANY